MTFFVFLASIKVIFLGAVYGRLDGGGIAKVSEWVERSLIMFFFVLACTPFAGLWSLLAYAGVIGIATGHGQYFLARTVKHISPERLDFIVRLFFGQDPRTKYTQKDNIEAAIAAYGNNRLYWRCVFGMFVTGSFVGLPAVIISLCFGAFTPALWLSLTGVVKALAYMTGYALFKNTESAEYINGAGRNVLCLGAIFWALTFLT